MDFIIGSVSYLIPIMRKRTSPILAITGLRNYPSDSSLELNDDIKGLHEFTPTEWEKLDKPDKPYKSTAITDSFIRSSNSL
jgi:hypothetical protein